MYNWSVDEEKLKANPEAYEIWKLEQSINYGLGGRKLSRRLLEKYFNQLSIDDSHRRQFLELLLWGKKS